MEKEEKKEAKAKVQQHAEEKPQVLAAEKPKTVKDKKSSSKLNQQGQDPGKEKMNKINAKEEQ